MIDVFVIDDSKAMRAVYSRILAKDPEFRIVAEASDPVEAATLLRTCAPDVLLLDLEMPRMDGLTFLQMLMAKRPIGVVVCSTLTARGSELAVAALCAGAAGVAQKPTSPSALAHFGGELANLLRIAARSRPKKRPVMDDAPPERIVSPNGIQLVAIGASTGGTTAIESLLSVLPADSPPIAITQHMPAYIVGAFAARLDRESALTVREARDGELVPPGTAVVAPGDRHLTVRPAVGGALVTLRDGERVSGHRPSVDVLFDSAVSFGGAAVGVLLTGMGRDGAIGLHAMREAGATTFVQDEASCVVFGMPKAALEVDPRHRVVPLTRMAAAIPRAG